MQIARNNYIFGYTIANKQHILYDYYLYVFLIWFKWGYNSNDPKHGSLELY